MSAPLESVPVISTGLRPTRSASAAHAGIAASATTLVTIATHSIVVLSSPLPSNVNRGRVDDEDRADGGAERDQRHAHNAGTMAAQQPAEWGALDRAFPRGLLKRRVRTPRPAPPRRPSTSSTSPARRHPPARRAHVRPPRDAPRLHPPRQHREHPPSRATCAPQAASPTSTCLQSTASPGYSNAAAPTVLRPRC
jgi:hypothetical protein